MVRIAASRSEASVAMRSPSFPAYSASASSSPRRKVLEEGQASGCSTEHPPGNCVELGEQRRFALLGRGHDGVIERPVGADRARLMLAREVADQPDEQPLHALAIDRKSVV